MTSNDQIIEAGEATEGQGWNPSYLAKFQAQRLQIGQVTKVVGPQNRLVKEDITTLNVDMSGTGGTLDGGCVILRV